LEARMEKTLFLLLALWCGTASAISIEKGNLRRANDAPNVVTKGTCEELLEKMSKVEKADDDKEEGVDCGAECPCNEPRTNMLSQCAGQVEDFYVKVEKYCPKLVPERSNEFHATPYVEKLPESASPSDTPVRKNPPASSPDGKPVEAWEAFPAAANAASEEKMAAAQAGGCKGDGCKGVLGPADGMTVASNAIGASQEPEAPEPASAPAKIEEPVEA